MIQPKTPKLNSRYIPVQSIGFVPDGIHWWKNDSDFMYPNLLINLMTVTREQLDEAKINDDVFLLTDSGGFQVIDGQCNIDWKESLEIQIKLRATKIFSFDTPPVKRLVEGQTKFVYFEEEKARETIENNLKVALEQSKYIKEHHPKFLDRFCYVLHAGNKEHLDFNLELFDKYIGGIENFDKYFPGGVCYAVKNDDPLPLALTSYHARKHFIEKGIYVHFLGCGSFNKMIILIKNKITTFDSSNALRGAINWTHISPLRSDKSFNISKDDYWFKKPFCNCPACQGKDFIKMISENETKYGRNIVKHNLWYMIKQNIFLDALKDDKYTQVVKEVIKPNKEVIKGIEFIDYAEENGYEVAYQKYKHYFKTDETKQQGLF